MKYVSLRQTPDGWAPIAVIDVADSIQVNVGPSFMRAPSHLPEDQLVKDYLFRDGMWVRRRAPEPVVVAKESPTVSSSRREVVWSGIVTGRSGYAKANREVVLRVANKVQVFIDRAACLHFPNWGLEPYDQARIDALSQIPVSKKAPHVRFFTPMVYESRGRRCINFTMLETQTVHKTFSDRLNNYDEVWVPTPWNKGIFEEAGIKIPVRVVPLGVESSTFNPYVTPELPKMKLVTTTRSWTEEKPRGFIFLTLGVPVFRKNFGLITKAIEAAFEEKDDVSLILGSTVHSDPHSYFKNAVKDIKKVRIYVLEGDLTEDQMASLYRASNCYVSASHGEGWNLPMCEAAACGIPVIVPRNTSHLDLCDKNCYFFDPDGTAKFPESSRDIEWFDEQLFSSFGKRSLDNLIACMRSVRFHYDDALKRGLAFGHVMRSKYPWERSAAQVVELLSRHWR